MLYHLQPNNFWINDLNEELINSYRSLNRDYAKVKAFLDDFKKSHDEKFYKEMRLTRFNNKYKRAARLIYLNKTCFNGIYRVNKNNEFNVPWNKITKEKLVLYDEQNLINIQSFFKQSKSKFTSKDYQTVLEKTTKNDFVFIDPPYDYELNNKTGFQSYTKEGFGKYSQMLLANWLKQLTARGIKWMLTNHNTELINSLYKEFKIIPITTNRSINSIGEQRKGTGKEVVIINYEPSTGTILENNIYNKQYIKWLNRCSKNNF